MLRHLSPEDVCNWKKLWNFRTQCCWYFVKRLCLSLSTDIVGFKVQTVNIVSFGNLLWRSFLLMEPPLASTDLCSILTAKEGPQVSLLLEYLPPCYGIHNNHPRHHQHFQRLWHLAACKEMEIVLHNSAHCNGCNRVVGGRNYLDCCLEEEVQEVHQALWWIQQWRRQAIVALLLEFQTYWCRFSRGRHRFCYPFLLAWDIARFIGDPLFLFLSIPNFCLACVYNGLMSRGLLSVIYNTDCSIFQFDM